MIVEGDHPKPIPLKAVVQGALVPHPRTTDCPPSGTLLHQFHVGEDAWRGGVVLQRTWIFAQVELSGPVCSRTQYRPPQTGENILNTLPVWIATSTPDQSQRCHFCLLPGNGAIGPRQHGIGRHQYPGGRNDFHPGIGAHFGVLPWNRKTLLGDGRAKAERPFDSTGRTHVSEMRSG